MAYQKRGRKPNGIKKDLTVKWIVVNKKIIKFIEEEDKTYKLADNVLDFLDSIKANIPVNVTIVDDKVIYIAVREGEVNNTPEPEPETQEPTNKSGGQLDENVYTIKAISKTRDYYLFDEAGEKEWFTIASNVKDFLKDVKKGDVLEAKVEVANSGKKDIKTIVFAKIKTSNTTDNPGKTEEPKNTNTFKKKSSYRDEESMDKRTALMTAKDLVVALINDKKIDNNQVKGVLTDLTKACYNALLSI